MNSEDNKTKPFLVELTETTCSTAVVEVQARTRDEAVELATMRRYEGLVEDRYFSQQDVEVSGKVVSRSRYTEVWSEVNRRADHDAPLRFASATPTSVAPVQKPTSEPADAEGVEERKRVPLRLQGLDGNAFSLLGAFARAARQHGWAEAEITEVFDLAKSGDYDHLLQVLIAHTKDPGE